MRKRDATPMLTSRPTFPWKLLLALGGCAFFIVEGALQIRHHHTGPGVLHLAWGVLFIPFNVKLWLSSRHHVHLSTEASFPPVDHVKRVLKVDGGTASNEPSLDTTSIHASTSASPKKFYTFLLRNRWYRVNDESTAVVPLREMLAAAAWLVMISAGVAIISLNVVANESLSSGGLQFLAALLLLVGVTLFDVMASIGMINNVIRIVKEKKATSR